MDNRNTQPDSLVAKNWDLNKQEIWLARKSNAVTQAADYLTTAKPDFENFYDFLIAKRSGIAEELTPKLVADIRTRREGAFHTELSNVNGYSDYLDSVIELFGDLFNKAKYDNKGDEDKENAGMANMFAHYFAISNVSVNNEKISNKGYVTVDVKNNNVNYSKIYKFDRVNEASGEKAELIVISHPSGDAIKQAFSEASNLYNELQTNGNLSQLQKIERVKKIAWHMMQAMPQARGSAAIGEMLIESLMKYHNIEFQLEKNLRLQTNGKSPSVDLIAMLSPTPEAFCSRVMLNARMEQSVTDEMSQKDNERIVLMKNIDEVGMPSLRNYINLNGELVDSEMKLGDKLKLVRMFSNLGAVIRLTELFRQSNLSDPIYATCNENLRNIEKLLITVLVKHNLIESIINKVNQDLQSLDIQDTKPVQRNEKRESIANSIAQILQYHLAYPDVMGKDIAHEAYKILRQNPSIARDYKLGGLVGDYESLLSHQKQVSSADYKDIDVISQQSNLKRGVEGGDVENKNTLRK